jgi:hypothetical protein
MHTHRILLAVALTATLAACGANPSPQTDPTRNLSPEAKAAYQTMKVGKALDVIRDVAAEGERQHLISAQSALKVIAYHKQVVQTMAAVPEGWTAVAIAGLNQLKQDLTVDEWRQIEPFANLLLALYQTFGPVRGATPDAALYTQALYEGGL